MTPEDWRQLEGTLREEAGASQTTAARAVHAFKRWLQREVGVPSNTPREEVVSATDEEIALLKTINGRTEKMIVDAFRR